LKLLLDEMWSPHIAEQLRSRQHDVSAVAERADLRKQPDEVIVAAALRESRAILTEDRRDYRMLRQLAIDIGEEFPWLIFTDNAAFPRSHPRTVGRVVVALDALLTADPVLDSGELWL
jgi:predicted nuclease of predicted toxin-antitoxin system